MQIQKLRRPAIRIVQNVHVDTLGIVSVHLLLNKQGETRHVGRLEIVVDPDFVH